MRKNIMRFLLCLLAGFCIAAAAKVVTDYSHFTDFSQYKTYSWVTVEAGNPLWTDRIKSAVDSQLTAKGWSKEAGESRSGNVQEFPAKVKGLAANLAEPNPYNRTQQTYRTQQT